ncbi:MAG TPA: carboxy-S-adenosyl-L-methionine synthase CmoA [Gammaproteobacteria bacterium]|jgi:tRNA (cmo5U34)-methyltransferase|nr:carboxy-S-adenosyl-L-methionine synthase CmoA [Gammaproteobacteria bacterium]
MSEGKMGGPSKPQKDEIFAEPQPKIADFNFGKKTSEVFDDMLNRSVPFYGEIQRMISELVADFAQESTQIYDLGCSTCYSFVSIDQYLPEKLDVQFIGIDSSEEMLNKARQKLTDQKFARRYELQCADLDKGVHVVNASVVMLILTLQFVRPLYREQLIETIRQGMTDNGCLILVEKVLGENSTFNRLFINHYYDMKRRNGYSEMEIAQKREALENVLIPYRLEENKQLLYKTGFKHVEVFFKWYNFCGIIALN